MNAISEITTEIYYEYGYMHYIATLHDVNNYLRADMDPESRELRIEIIHTNSPRQGLGKCLLEKVKRDAQSLGSTVITATIVSPECLASIETVFGSEHVEVTKRSDFGAPGTQAWLRYPLAEGVI